MSDPDASLPTARHNNPVAALSSDPDPRFRPGPALRGLLAHHGGQGSVDRPLVPVLNALNDRGITTWACCAHNYLTVVGTGERTALAMAAIAEPWMTVSWTRGGTWAIPTGGGTTALTWDHTTSDPDLVDAWALSAAAQLAQVELPAADRPSAAQRLLDRMATVMRRAGAEGLGPGLDLPRPYWNGRMDPRQRGLEAERDAHGWSVRVDSEVGENQPLMEVRAASLPAVARRAWPALALLLRRSTVSIRAEETAAVLASIEARVDQVVEFLAGDLRPHERLRVLGSDGSEAIYRSVALAEPEGATTHVVVVDDTAVLLSGGATGPCRVRMDGRVKSLPVADAMLRIRLMQDFAVADHAHDALVAARRGVSGTGEVIA